MSGIKIDNVLVDGCTNCPFCVAQDMGTGWDCRIDREERSIKADRNFQPKTPEWCPLNKIEAVLVKAIERKQGRL
jgi:hypothetical protein